MFGKGAVGRQRLAGIGHLLIRAVAGMFKTVIMHTWLHNIQGCRVELQWP